MNVEVISGHREAELIFGAIRASVLLEPAPALCFDLGGGSVEIMVGDAGGLHYATSENLGVGRLTAEFVALRPHLQGRPPPAPRPRSSTCSSPIADAVARYEPKLVIGSSGTLEDIGRMVAERREHDVPSLAQPAVVHARRVPARCYRQILASTSTERLRLEGLEARRVDLIDAGVIFLETAMELFGFEEMTISEWALREGIVLDAIGRHDPDDWSDDPRAIRRASVNGLARRCNAPEAHSRHVARSRARAVRPDRRSCTGSAPTTASCSSTRRCSTTSASTSRRPATTGTASYLIRHGQLRGFDPAEIQLLAALARWHRRGDPKPGDEFPLADPDRLRKLTALLRLADGLDRSRSGAVDDIDVRVGPSLVVVRLHADHDVELELWGARRKRELFEKVFERDLELRTTAPDSPRSCTLHGNIRGTCKNAGTTAVRRRGRSPSGR